MTESIIPNIRPLEVADWPSVRAILRTTFQAGDTYSFAPDSSEAEIHTAWVELPAATFVACAGDGRVIGTYFIKANQPGLGVHVCNCGYVVAHESQGQGVAAAMCVHSQAHAVEMGFRAMQSIEYSVEVILMGSASSRPFSARRTDADIVDL